VSDHDPTEVVRELYDAFEVGDHERIRRCLAAPGHVTVTGTYQGTHRATGRTLEAEFCHLWTVEDGQITGFRQFTDTAAFAAATAAGDG
jgi:ketosteroid isomerase-like protein